MKLYLDIDGVMVPANSWRRPEILEDGFPKFSSRAVHSLDRILSQSGADIILTTSHKHKYTLKEWKNIFQRRNLKVNNLDRLPENTRHLTREQELLNWFDAEKLNDNFIIIDDDKSLNALPVPMKKRLVLTSGSVGLTDHLADEALNIIDESKYYVH